jgi:carbonic anhydrase
MSVVPEFLKANEVYAAYFRHRDLPMPPARRVAVLACMDARLDPARALGLREGDAHVIRNAAGRAADALRSLAISRHLLGTREVVVIHHADCGMLTFSDEQLRTKVRESSRPTPRSCPLRTWSRAFGTTCRPFAAPASCCPAFR